MSLLLAAIAAEPPLDPSGDQARSLLGRELAHVEYQRSDPIQRLVTWMLRLLDDTINAASGTRTVSAFLAILAFLLLLLALGWLLSRARRSARQGRTTDPVLVDRTVSAAELRAAAERALAEGRHGDAVVEGFRALTVRQVERGGLDDRPGTTAHEVAVALASAYPEQGGVVGASAALFDAVRYGDRPASRDQAVGVLALDDALAGRR